MKRFIEDQGRMAASFWAMAAEYPAAPCPRCGCDVIATQRAVIDLFGPGCDGAGAMYVPARKCTRCDLAYCDYAADIWVHDARDRFAEAKNGNTGREVMPKKKKKKTKR